MAAVAKVGLLAIAAVLLGAIAAAAIYLASVMRLNARPSAPEQQIPVRTDIAAIQHGQHLASAVAICVDCHTPNLAGKIIVDDPRTVRIVAPNLTRGQGGAGATFSDADFVRAIRYGIDPSGRQLWLMPADDYNHFSDADLGDVIAFIKSLPAVNTALPSKEIRPLGRLLFLTGQLMLLPADELDRSAPRPSAPPPDVSPAYGQYLANIASCPRCHGPGLSGGRIPGAPPDVVPAANITPAALGDWSEADFVRSLRTGRAPDGHLLDASMPWQYFAQMTDLELAAIWQFLEVVPPRLTGTH
jgi:mono/diheme cytochrome c family protein